MADVKFIDHAPKVFVVGVTNFSYNLYQYLEYRGADWNIDYRDQLYGVTSDAIIEAAGRVCYQSWENPAGKSREEYIQSSIIEHKHGSVLEHLWFNCLVADLPRSSQLELVRHGEGTAFSFESTRFTNKHVRFVIPPRLRNNYELVDEFKTQCLQSYNAYLRMVKVASSDADEGTLKRKRALEAARSLLPNALGSDGMVSLNARAARHIIELRTDEHADQSIREFAHALFLALRPYAVSVFADAELVGVPEGVPQVKFKVSKV